MNNEAKTSGARLDRGLGAPVQYRPTLFPFYHMAQLNRAQYPRASAPDAPAADGFPEREHPVPATLGQAMK